MKLTVPYADVFLFFEDHYSLYSGRMAWCMCLSLHVIRVSGESIREPDQLTDSPGHLVSRSQSLAESGSARLGPPVR